MTDRHENLLAAYFSGQTTESEKEEIASLLKTDKEFAGRFSEAQKAYVAACIPAFEKTKDEDYKKLEERITPRRAFNWALAFGLAAVVFLGAALFTGYKYLDAERFLSQSETTTISSTRGTVTRTQLPDGTRVCLNAGSSITFDRSFGRKGRNVTLDGEGYFEVASDKARLFKVCTGNACVTVKGTVFNVRSYADEPEIAVSLLEGSVLLSAPEGETTLKPGTCGIVSREEGNIRLEKASQSVASWTKGRIHFTDRTIPEILADLHRTYCVDFVYEDGLFGDERFSGSISSNLSIDEILSYLDVDHKFRWTREEDKIEIHKK